MLLSPVWEAGSIEKRLNEKWRGLANNEQMQAVFGIDKWSTNHPISKLSAKNIAWIEGGFRQGGCSWRSGGTIRPTTIPGSVRISGADTPGAGEALEIILSRLFCPMLAHILLLEGNPCTSLLA